MFYTAIKQARFLASQKSIWKMKSLIKLHHHKSNFHCRCWYRLVVEVWCWGNNTWDPVATWSPMLRLKLVPSSYNSPSSPACLLLRHLFLLWTTFPFSSHCLKAKTSLMLIISVLKQLVWNKWLSIGSFRGRGMNDAIKIREKYD